MTIQEELGKAWRLGTAPFRAMPSFVIVGAPKCGTSSLYDDLASHPDVRRGARKEPTNFLHYPGSRLRSAMNYPVRFGKGQFVVGDGSVEYFSHPDGPRNVRAVLPEARLIFLLRDPVRRAWSDYWMFREFGTEREEFEPVVDRAMDWLRQDDLRPLVESVERVNWNPLRYVLIGEYARVIERWLEVWPREQCLFLLSEEFSTNRTSVLMDVQRHLGLRERELPELPRARLGKISEKLDPAVESRMREYYAPHNARLAEILGRSLPWA